MGGEASSKTMWGRELLVEKAGDREGPGRPHEPKRGFDLWAPETPADSSIWASRVRQRLKSDVN